MVPSLSVNVERTSLAVVKMRSIRRVDLTSDQSVVEGTISPWDTKLLHRIDDIERHYQKGIFAARAMKDA